MRKYTKSEKILKRERRHGILRTESDEYYTWTDMQPNVPKEKCLVKNKFTQLLHQSLQIYKIYKIYTLKH